MQKGDLILVKWRDTKGTQTWIAESQFLKERAPVILSPGIFMSEDESSLHIAMDWSDDGDLIGTIFPKGCIVSVQRLRVED